MDWSCADQEIFARGTSSGKFFLLFFFCFFVVVFVFFGMRGVRIKITLKAGHHRSARQRNAISMADDGPTLNAGLVDL